MGIVEDVADPLKSGRVRVRILGLHSPDINVLPTSALPWSQVMLSSVEAAVDGIGITPIGLVVGSFVFGIFLDGMNRQTFLVMGSMPGQNQVMRRLDADARKGPVFMRDFLIANGFNEVQQDGILAIMSKAAHFSQVDKALSYAATGPRMYSTFWARVDPKYLEILKAHATETNCSPDDLETQMETLVKVLGTSSWPKYEAYQRPGVLKTYVAKTAEQYGFSLSQALHINWKELPRNIVPSTPTGSSNVTAPTPTSALAINTATIKAEVRKMAAIAPARSLKNAYGEIIRLPSDNDSLHALLNSCTRRNSNGEPLDGLVVHATASFDNSQGGRVGLDAIKEFHMNANGWSDIGYHFVIDRNGDIYIGRNINVQGAHAAAPRDQYPGRDWNFNTVGLALFGGLGPYPTKADGSKDNKRAQDIIDGKRMPKIANSPYELYTREQISALLNFIRVFKKAFPNSTVVSHEYVDRKYRKKQDPYFDLEKFIADNH